MSFTRKNFMFSNFKGKKILLQEMVGGRGGVGGWTGSPSALPFSMATMCSQERLISLGDI